MNNRLFIVYAKNVDSWGSAGVWLRSIDDGDELIVRFPSSTDLGNFIPYNAMTIGEEWITSRGWLRPWERV